MKIAWCVFRVKNMHPGSTSHSQLERCCQGKAEVRIIKFKTTWSEFQMPSQTAPTEAKPSCVYSNLKPLGQSFKRPVRLLPCEAKPSYTCKILKKTSPHQSRSQAVVCVSTLRMYPRSGYFLVTKSVEIQ